MEKTFNLNISDRIVLSSLLPTEGGFEFLTCREEIINKIKISSDEIEKHKINIIPNERGEPITSWEKGDIIYEYSFNKLQSRHIKNQLLILDKAEKLTPHHLNLYKQFAK